MNQIDEEMSAMKTCVEALRPLGDAARARVLTWLNNACGTHSSSPPSKLREALSSKEFEEKRTAQARYLWIVRFLCGMGAKHPLKAVEIAEGLKGDSRVYFAQDAKTIEEAGSGAKAVRLGPGYPLWADVNNSTETKRRILRDLMTRLDYPEDEIGMAQAAI